MLMSEIMSNFHGGVLALGTKVNSPILCSLSFGKTDIGTNSKAVRIAAEK